MTVDEMDLVSQLKQAASLRPTAYEQARATLRAAMADPGPAAERLQPRATTPARRQVLPLWRNRRGTVGTLGKTAVSAGVAAVAATVAVVLVAAPAPRPAGAAGATSPAPSAGTHSAAPAGNGKLMSLAAFITASSRSLPGNASLVIRTQTIGRQPSEVTYNLYTDSGAYYVGDNKSTLMQAVAQHANLAYGIDAREAAAARYAVTGNLSTARDRMIDATPNWFALGQSSAVRKRLWEKGAAQTRRILREKGVKTALKEPTGQALADDINNYLWNNSVDALTEAGGNPQIRAGVFRLLATIPQVTVTDSTADGRPTLTVTAGSALFGIGSPQVLTVNARTGVPTRSVFAASKGVPSSVDIFRVSRVSMAGIRAGKF